MSTMPSTDTSQVQLTAFTTVRADKTEKVDPHLKQEIEQYINDLNHETAQYCIRAVALGGSQDSEDLRDELKHIRKRALEIAKINKSKLIPVLRKTTICSEDIKELERQFNMFSACLELLEIEMDKTLLLQTKFPFHSGAKLLINTGITDPHIKCRSHCSKSTSNAESTDSQHREKEEIKNLERDLIDLHEFLYNINQTVAIEPWASEQITYNSKDCKEYLQPKRSSVLSGQMNLTEAGSDGRKRRCICLAVFFTLFICISAIVIGLSLGFLQ